VVNASLKLGQHRPGISVGRRWGFSSYVHEELQASPRPRLRTSSSAAFGLPCGASCSLRVALRSNPAVRAVSAGGQPRFFAYESVRPFAVYPEQARRSSYSNDDGARLPGARNGMGGSEWGRGPRSPR